MTDQILTPALLEDFQSVMLQVYKALQGWSPEYMLGDCGEDWYRKVTADNIGICISNVDKLKKILEKKEREKESENV